MNRYDYEREEQERINHIIIAQNGESYVGVGGLFGCSIVLAAAVIAYIICMSFCPLTMVLLLGAVNRRDNKPGRSLRDMFRAHPVIRVLSYADMVLFGISVLMIAVVAQLSRYGQLPLSAYIDSPICQIIGWLGYYPVYGLMAVGTVLLGITAAARFLPENKR